MVRTKRVKDRRSLRFGRMQDLLDDLERLGEAPRIRTSGNWTPGQIVQHVTKLVDGSLDGFGFRAPLPLRLMGKALRSAALNRPLMAGIRLRGRMKQLEPDPSVTWEQAVADLRRQVERIEQGARMTRNSPFLGELVHEEWEQLHCRHAEMHFSFMHAEESD